MKFSCVAVVVLLTGLAVIRESHSFSAVAPPSKMTNVGGGSPNVDPVDKSMKGIDDDGGSAFDPTSGSNAALMRNNKGEVWVSQVRCACVGLMHPTLPRRFGYQTIFVVFQRVAQ
jgi:hypothetical protein